MAGRDKIIEVRIPFPVNGAHDGLPVSDQPPLTTVDCQNVYPWTRNLRNAGGTRCGTRVLSKLDNSPIQGMIQTLAVVNGQIDRRFTVVCGGNVYDGPNTASLALANNGGGTVFVGSMVCMVSTSTGVYIVDPNGGIRKLTWSAIGGATVSIPTWTPSNPPAKAAVACLWRGRLLLAGIATDPHNVYASNVGVTSWDTSLTAPTDAWTLNAATAGTIGDSVTALIPASDDTLLIGGTRTLWRLDGDPAAGGSLSLVSASSGISGPFAWCQSPEGSVYFYGPGGFYRYGKGGAMANLSQNRMDRAFRYVPTGYPAANGLSRSVRMVYDPKRFGVWFFPGVLSAKPAFYDARNDGWFPMKFPDYIGPTCLLDCRDDTSSAMNDIYLGGPGGEIFAFGDNLANDGMFTAPDRSAAISAYVHLGPVKPGGGTNNAKLLSLDLTASGPQDPGFTDGSVNLDFTVKAGREESIALNAPDATFAGTVTKWGRNLHRTRLAGQSFYLSLSNSTLGKMWAIDHVIARFTGAGRTR